MTFRPPEAFGKVPLLLGFALDVPVEEVALAEPVRIALRAPAHEARARFVVSIASVRRIARQIVIARASTRMHLCHSLTQTATLASFDHMRASMNISLPETMKRWVDEQVDVGGYGTASEYIRELLRREQQRALQGEINANLLAAIKTPASPLTGKDWEEIRREGKKLAVSRKKKRA